ncbi:hypothetical protein [Pediococcus pentosaceus]|jgi:hypothetical protein|uniref:hypothetical protein n=1 Tax=Pediococcus pentosaceus TaxID=1255 RepID=UPI0021E7F677|nr:hypothetical protein [Pediococcus pentosaceus]MCV3320569.1 hypothetical protein [Pediococcus pentosaceus]MCV3330453.1 hypothetical protein [Pediococcus pentosaceus]
MTDLVVIQPTITNNQCHLFAQKNLLLLQQPVLYAYKLGVAQVDKAFWLQDACMKSLIEKQ